MNTGGTSFTFNTQRVNEGIGEMTIAKNEMDDYANDIMTNTRQIRKNSLFEYCTALDQMLKELEVRAQGLAYGDSILDIANKSILVPLKSAKNIKEEYERVSSQYYLDDINFTSILELLKNLKYAAAKVNYSDGLIGNLFVRDDLNLNTLSTSLTSMNASANKVNESVVSLKDGREATRNARWAALTASASKFIINGAEQATNNVNNTVSNLTQGSQTTTNTTPNKGTSEKETIKEEKKEEKNEEKNNEEKEIIIINPFEKKEEEVTISSNNGNNNYQENSNTGGNNNIPNNEMEIPEESVVEEPIEIEAENQISEEVEPITISTTPAVSKTEDKGIGIGTVLTGLGAAAAVGVGAKVYLDSKKNKENEEEIIDEDLEEDKDETFTMIDNTDDISVEAWEETNEYNDNTNFEEESDFGEI